jgi:hypothetical protein
MAMIVKGRRTKLRYISHWARAEMDTFWVLLSIFEMSALNWMFPAEVSDVFPLRIIVFTCILVMCAKVQTVNGCVHA